MIKYYYLDDPYRGKRLFKHDTWNNTVVQVVVSPGNLKKGRPNMIGVYRISEATLKGNYLWKVDGRLGVDIRMTTEKLFKYYIIKVVTELLKDSDHGENERKSQLNRT